MTSWEGVAAGSCGPAGPLRPARLSSPAAPLALFPEGGNVLSQAAGGLAKRMSKRRSVAIGQGYCPRRVLRRAKHCSGASRGHRRRLTGEFDSHGFSGGGLNSGHCSQRELLRDRLAITRCEGRQSEERRA